MWAIKHTNGLFYCGPIEWEDSYTGFKCWFDDRLKFFNSYMQAEDCVVNCLSDDDAFDCHIIELTNKYY